MNELEKINAKRQAATRTLWVWLTVILALATFNNTGYAEQPSAPCFPNPCSARLRPRSQPRRYSKSA